MKLKILGLVLALTSISAFSSESKYMKDLLEADYKIVAGWSNASNYGSKNFLVLRKDAKVYICEINEVSYSECKKTN